ncbi:MAG: hypothetical protein AAF570_29170, partial [Bacteroidota bacterium]
MTTFVARAIRNVAFSIVIGGILVISARFSPLSAQLNGLTPPSIANVEIPPSPDAAALATYAEIPVSLYTGIPQIS